MLREVRRMAVARHDGNNRFGADIGNDYTPFLEHNKRMRQFRESHTSDLQVRAGLPGRTLTSDAADIIVEAVGPRDLADPVAWLVLVPVWKVMRYRFWLN